MITLLSPTLRINYLKTIAPSLSLKTCQYLKNNLGFGDWLILVMMSLHLDIKLFTDILKEIKNVGFNNSRSVSTAIDIISPSDTENEQDDQNDFPKISVYKSSKLGLKRVSLYNNFSLFVQEKKPLFSEFYRCRCCWPVWNKSHYAPRNDCGRVITNNMHIN